MHSIFISLHVQCATYLWQRRRSCMICLFWIAEFLHGRSLQFTNSSVRFTCKILHNMFTCNPSDLSVYEIFLKYNYLCRDDNIVVVAVMGTIVGILIIVIVSLVAVLIMYRHKFRKRPGIILIILCITSLS